MLEAQNQWLRLISERTRFVTPDGKVWRMETINTFQQGRVVDLVEDPHGRASIKFISTWNPFTSYMARRK
jgi:hypothetical protein